MRLLPDACPHCGEMLDAVGVAGGADAVPEPGDVSACLKCGNPMVFMEGLRLRAMTKDEWESLPEKHRRELASVREFVTYVARTKQARWN